jgi:hypothetical protein
MLLMNYYSLFRARKVLCEIPHDEIRRLSTHAHSRMWREKLVALSQGSQKQTLIRDQTILSEPDQR